MATQNEIDLMKTIIDKDRAWALWLDIIAKLDGRCVSSLQREYAENLAERIREEAEVFERRIIDIAKEGINEQAERTRE